MRAPAGPGATTAPPLAATFTPPGTADGAFAARVFGPISPGVEVIPWPSGLAGGTVPAAFRPPIVNWHPAVIEQQPLLRAAWAGRRMTRWR